MESGGKGAWSAPALPTSPRPNLTETPTRGEVASWWEYAVASTWVFGSIGLVVESVYHAASTEAEREHSTRIPNESAIY